MPHSSEVRLIEKSRRPLLISPIASLPRCSGVSASGGRRTSRGGGPRSARGGRTSSPPRSTRRALVDRAAVGGPGRRSRPVVVGVVLLAGHAVLAGERVELDVAGVVAALQQFGDGGLVARFGGADEVVVGDVEPLPRRGELRGDLVGELLRGHAGGLGDLLDLEAVLVGAGHVLDVVAEQAVPAGERVADDRGVRVAEVGLGVHVVDRRRQVEPGHACSPSSDPRLAGSSTSTATRAAARSSCRRRRRRSSSRSPIVRHDGRDRHPRQGRRRGVHR
jgi:hypothetical protein